MELETYSMGVGDRFAQQGRAQLQAMIAAQAEGALVVPVWNKSNREHQIIGTEPGSVRAEADAAVAALNWDAGYHVDADHIGLGNVDGFLAASDFFTLDVAEVTGKPASDEDIQAYLDQHESYIGQLDIPGLDQPFEITRETITAILRKYLLACQEAAKIYQKIRNAKGEGAFVTEVSMDETDQPQTPEELFFILSCLAKLGVPAQTIAPKFTGRFNKGVDYVGDVEQFAREFEADVCVIRKAISEFGLPANLKLSVHSGSDKFSIYGPIAEILRKHDAGLHIKTAGTTWLEELIGLAESGAEGLAIAKEVYAEALAHADELCAPYATVIDIDTSKLPGADVVNGWSGEQYANALRHDQSCAEYNPNVRQLLHVGYKVAAKMGQRYLDAVAAAEEHVARNVTGNLLDRHIRPLFLAK